MTLRRKHAALKAERQNASRALKFVSTLASKRHPMTPPTQASSPLSGAPLPLLLVARRKTASFFPSPLASLAALAATLSTLSLTTGALPTFLPLPAIAHPCTTPAPLLATNRFAFGCRRSTTPGASSFLLSVFFNSMPAGPAVWIANPARPVSQNASLLLSSSAHLVLYGPDTSATSPAWSLAFSASSPPAGIALDDSGNLIILDHVNSSLWQSFLHPLDLLLPGQIMTPGMKLIAGSRSPPPTVKASAESSTYYAIMEPEGLAFFTNFSDSRSLQYSIFSLDRNSGRLDDAYCNGGIDSSGHSIELQFSYDATQIFLHGCMGNVSMNRSIAFGIHHETVDFLRLDSDGNMRGYKYNYGNATWHVVYDWFANNPSISYGICNLPRVCGPYGICNHLAKNKCSCPHLSSTHEQLFLPLNSSDLRKGCQLAHPLDCSGGNQSHDFIELQGADYFANDALSNENFSKSTKQECVASCARNCTCKAAFYRADIGACFQYEQVLSIIGGANASTKLFDSSQIAGNITKKALHVIQHLAGGASTFAAQLLQNSAQSNSTQQGNSSSTDVLNNYVCFLKVKNNAVQGTMPSTGALSAKAGDKRYVMITIWSAVAGLFLLGVTVGLFCVCCKKRRRFKALRDEEFCTGTLPGQLTIAHFTFAQLQEASGDFKCKLGVGGFGSVYKGILPNGSIVAIKQLENAIRADKEFESQVASLHSLNHPNLVRLSGFCSHGLRRLLISDYMMHGSLDAWLFTSKSQDKACLTSSTTDHASSLDWKTRFGIALDVAEGLAFLHENDLVHLAIKPQNILLDDGFVAKLSDYGLSRLMDQEEGCLIMHMRGATGYMAPEWLQHACATEKSDVYSYGMVLMEMLGGRRNVDLSKERESWFFPLVAAKMYKEGRVLEVLDENLTKSATNAMGEAECEQAKRVMEIAFWCIVECPTKRPDMGSIVCMLQGHQEVPEPPVPISFGGVNVHTSMSNLDDNHHHFHHDYYEQSGASSPSCFNISLTSEPETHNSWLCTGGHQDYCSLLLPSQI